jgi:DNA gyrase subunit A
MVQDFSLRYPLIDGQGNFGSIDGDAPAAMRYTEIRLARIAEEILKDIEKETVDFRPNYDDSLVEPVVLPAKYPTCSLMVHRVLPSVWQPMYPPQPGEVIDGTIAYIDNRKSPLMS